MTVIRSSSNSALKRVRAVAAGRERDSILLEGERLVRDALEAGVRPELILVAESRAALVDEFSGAGAELRSVQDSLLDALSGLRTSPGLLALAPRPRAATLEDLAPGPETRLVVAAGISDPGNLGALARSAEASGCAGLVVLAGSARPWSDKALRGSMGSLLRLPVIEFASAAEACAQLEARGYRQLRAATRGGREFDRCEWSGPLALWFPPETGELDEAVSAHAPVSIPMSGGVESLNVAVAAAVLLFAAARPVESPPPAPSKELP